MRNITLLALAISITLFACNKKNADSPASAKNIENEQLAAEIALLQDSITSVSNELTFQMADPAASYTEPAVEENIVEFTSLRIVQRQKLTKLTSNGGTSDAILLVCADFEDMDCFTDNWDILKDDDQTLKIDNSISYNKSVSLFMSSPYKPGSVNQRSLSINGYINNIEAQTVYKIRFWAKLYGYTSRDNGPSLQVIAMQDGDWLGDGHIVVGDGSYTNKDWRLYSFQVITKSNSPLAIQCWTNMEHCWIDDIHIVKKKD